MASSIDDRRILVFMPRGHAHNVWNKDKSKIGWCAFWFVKSIASLSYIAMRVLPLEIGFWKVVKYSIRAQCRHLTHCAKFYQKYHLRHIVFSLYRSFVVSLYRKTILEHVHQLASHSEGTKNVPFYRLARHVVNWRQETRFFLVSETCNQKTVYTRFILMLNLAQKT